MQRCIVTFSPFHPLKLPTTQTTLFLNQNTKTLLIWHLYSDAKMYLVSLLSHLTWLVPSILDILLYSYVFNCNDFTSVWCSPSCRGQQKIKISSNKYCSLRGEITLLNNYYAIMRNIAQFRCFHISWASTSTAHISHSAKV